MEDAYLSNWHQNMLGRGCFRKYPLSQSKFRWQVDGRANLVGFK